MATILGTIAEIVSGLFDFYSGFPARDMAIGQVVDVAAEIRDRRHAILVGAQEPGVTLRQS